MIIIVDYGVGNLTSVHKAFRKLRIEANISSTVADIGNADKLLLPGVGNFATCMQRLEERGLRPALEKFALVDRKPLLGICVGMQMLTEHSEEGDAPGLAWIPGRAARFPETANDAPLRVPHVGWNAVHDRSSPLFDGLNDDDRYYFAHSYYVSCDDGARIAGHSHYGMDFAAAICRENIFGAQFHPEKSHLAGLAVLRNFAEKC
ncbi:MAG: imidazole glycerol phosphate synthase subunit HisH [Sphingomonadales bacterium]|nr:imidazole glycerol phosphate synthase subunit HisH [Sphingomonadales bacterium]